MTPQITILKLGSMGTPLRGVATHGPESLPITESQGCVNRRLAAVGVGEMAPVFGPAPAARHPLGRTTADRVAIAP